MSEVQVTIADNDQQHPVEIDAEIAQARLDALSDIVGQYDPASDDASYLRIHQVQAVTGYRERVTQIAEGVIPNRGMAILHPTGSGKTVTTAEIIRLSIDPAINGSRPRALMLVPGHSILSQTVGEEEETGAIESFAPNLQVGAYSGKSKTTDGDVVVMTYQALPWAMRRGDIDTIDPTLIICDEAHHVIDGVWAKSVERLAAAPGRILIGLTATPSYTKDRGVHKMFPDVIDQKSMREGIEEGILSELKGFIYKGSTRIKLKGSRGGDYEQEGLFDSLYKSPDNYMAAKICAAEVAMGRRGVVSCAPGLDRAHAKIVAEILNNTPVETEEGERNIRAAYLDGDLSVDERRRILMDYKLGRLDVITYVNLLLEGWDSPESDFTVLLRPTKSRVLAEQRLGRIVRSREGKVATVHEFIYDFDGEDNDAQITHMDVMDENVVVQGHSYTVSPEKAREYQKRYAERNKGGRFFSIDRLRFDPDLAQRIDEVDAVPLEELRIACGQEAIPINWLTSGYLARRFNISGVEVETVLTEAGILPRVEPIGDITHSYYPPKATMAVAEHLGIEQMPEGYLTLLDLVRMQRGDTVRRSLGRSALIRALDGEQIVSKTFIRGDGLVVDAYPPEAADIVPYNDSMSRKLKPASERTRKKEPVLKPAEEAIDWLRRVLVNPRDVATGTGQHEVIQAQKRLMAAIRGISQTDADSIRALHKELTELGVELDVAVINAAKSQRISPAGVIFAARRAISI